MDDQRFDDIIKNKVGEYVDPTYDKGAIAGLHQHLAGYQVVPWYSQYKSAGLMAATLALFTLFNWLMIGNSREGSDINQASLNNNPDYERLIADLKGEIDRLKTIQPDTIYVINSTPNTGPGVLTASLKSETNPDQVINSFLLRLKEAEQIGRVGDFYFYHKNEVPSYGEFLALNNRDSELSGSFLNLSYPEEDTIFKEGAVATIEQEQSRMPILIIRDLEKHYSKGLGLKLGAELELAQTKPDIGSGEALPGLGILAELVFSPSLGFETGIKYKTRSYSLEAPNSNELASYSGLDNSLGTVAELEIDAKLLEIPLNFKFYRSFAQNKDLYISLGISPNLYLSQAFDYSHTPPLVNFSGEVTVTNAVKVDGPEFYLGTFNAGAGLSFNLTKRREVQREVQLGIFYQKDLGGIGFEDRKMNIFGLKSSYWFRVR